MRVWRITSLMLFLLLLAGPPAHAQQAPLAGLDDYVNKAMKDWGVPGVAIAVIKDDRIVLAKGYGVCELGKPEPVDERTLFAIGSSSKAFTAAAIAMLVDDKKLKWDDPATQYLHGFQLYDPYVTRELTVRDLLTQTIIRLEGQMAALYPEAHFLTYGMGWFLSDYRGRKLVEHGGSIDGMRALVAMIPEEKVGVVILTNLSGTILSIPLSYRIFDAFLGASSRDWSAEMLKTMNTLEEQARAMAAKQEAERVTGTKPSLALDKYAGDYRSEMYGDTTVAFDNATLTLRRGPNFIGKLEHWHYDVVRVTWNDRQMGKQFVSFRLDQKGRVAEMNMENLADFRRVLDKPADATR